MVLYRNRCHSASNEAFDRLQTLGVHVASTTFSFAGLYRLHHMLLATFPSMMSQAAHREKLR